MEVQQITRRIKNMMNQLNVNGKLVIVKLNEANHKKNQDNLEEVYIEYHDMARTYLRNEMFVIYGNHVGCYFRAFNGESVNLPEIIAHDDSEEAIFIYNNTTTVASVTEAVYATTMQILAEIVQDNAYDSDDSSSDSSSDSSRTDDDSNNDETETDGDSDTGDVEMIVVDIN